MENGFQPKKAKQIHQPTKIPINKPPKTTVLPTKRGLHDKNRFITGLLPRPDCQKTLALPGITLPQLNVRTNGTPIWPELGPSNLCQNNKLDSQVTKKTEYTPGSVLRRLFDCKSEPTETEKGGVYSHKNSYNFRLQDKLGKVGVKPNERYNLPRNKLEYRVKPKKPSFKENPSIGKIDAKINKKQKMELATSKINIGQNGVRIIRDTTRTTTLSNDSKSGESPTRVKAPSPIRHKNRNSSRAAMVDRKPKTKFKHYRQRTRSISGDRCLKHRLGSRIGRQAYIRKMDHGTEKMAYKQKRNVCHLQDVNKLPRSTPKQKHSNTMRQQNSGGILKESGRNQIHSSSKASKRHSEPGKPQKYRDPGRAYPGALQRNIRPPVKRQKPTGLEFIQFDARDDLQEMGNSVYRPLCNPEISSYCKICHTIPMQAGRIRECLHKEVGIQTGMDISSTTINSKDFTTPKSMSRDLHLNSPQVGKCLLATCPQEESPRQTVYNTESRQSPHRPPNQSSTTQDTRFVLGSMESTGWADLVKNWSIEEKQILETSWRKSSLSTYSAAWKSWCHWAKERKISINNPNPTEVAQYLCFLYYKKKLSYGTIYLHKSTIATFSNPLNADKVSNNPLIKHILKGISNTNPRILRAKIWDINKLLSWINRNPPDPRSLFQISRHLALLLLLSSGRRVHDLTLLRIDPDFLIQSENEVIFWPQYGAKTDKPKYIQSGWKLLKNELQLWDVIYWLKQYIEISHQRRHTNSQTIPFLFVTTRGKTGPASRSVIAGWVRTALRSAGIEAGAGSTRSAVATFRFNNRLPLDEVLRKGSNNFFKHYYKELDESPINENSRDKNITDSFVPV
ncbi:uncharacterized protein [Maniola hyperantus]|uniref:uncharacterized protein isoform X1 n=1 Tax=Aphantopus hyperantus TaxID=2795564 RepID=UPI003747B3C5